MILSQKSVANYVKLYKVQINGISVRYADTDGGSQQKLPLVLFLHGWPESWFSYRYQLKECKNNGFRGVAPDMRGYGSTTAPPRAEQYNVYALAGDAVGLVHRLGYNKCMLVGHDHGAILSWKLKLMFPDLFVVLCALSVPYKKGRPKLPGLEVMRKSFGNETDKEHAKFFYQLHHQLYPQAAAEYDANTEEALFRIYSMNAMQKGMGFCMAQKLPLTKCMWTVSQGDGGGECQGQRRFRIGLMKMISSIMSPSSKGLDFKVGYFLVCLYKSKGFGLDINKAP